MSSTSDAINARRVGPYRLEEEVGRGGAGVVYRAVHVELERTVALKILPTLLGDDPDARARFRREGAVQARFEHPAIVPLYEVGESDEGLWLAMKLIDGPDLAAALDDGLAAEEAVGILRQVASALDAAHAAGIVHRDVKPHNILITAANRRAFLADFGLTKSVMATAMTRTGQLSGTLTYLAPEQIMGEPATPASDRYAFAAVAFEALTGRPPFVRDNEGALLFAHVSEEPENASSIAPSLPAAVDDVLARGLEKNPAARHESATQMVDELAKALGRTATSAAARRTRPDRTQHAVVADAAPAEAPARRALQRGLLIGVCGLAALGGFFVSRPSSEPARTASPVARDDLRLLVGERWARTKTATPVPGLSLTGAVAFRLETNRDVTLEVGRSRGDGPTLLPSTFRRRLSQPPVPVDPVEVGDFRAQRYRGLRPRGLDGEVTTYAIAAGAGVIAGNCVATSDVRSYEALCEDALSTLAVKGAEAAEIFASAGTAKQLTKVVEDLARDRASLRRRLASAETRKRQAQVALDLRSSFRRASDRVKEVDVGPADRPATRALSRALQQTGNAYGQLGGALTSQSDEPYRRARAAVDNAERAARRALRGFEELAYEVGG